MTQQSNFPKGLKGYGLYFKTVVPMNLLKIIYKQKLQDTCFDVETVLRKFRTTTSCKRSFNKLKIIEDKQLDKRS